MRYISLVILLLITLSFISCSTSSEAPTTATNPAPPGNKYDENNWLYGKWELTALPENSPQDYLVFHRDRSFKTWSPDNPPAIGTYAIEGSQIVVTMNVEGETTTKIYTADRDKRRVYSTPQPGSNPLEYRKVH